MVAEKDSAYWCLEQTRALICLRGEADIKSYLDDKHVIVFSKQIQKKEENI